MQPTQRNASLDVLRILAFLFVVGVHACLEGGFYYLRVTGPAIIPWIVLRVIFMCCVPLFMMLSGYLTLDKTWDRAYYLRLGRVVFVYVAACLVCRGYQCWYYQEAPDVRELLFDILDFDAAPYSWYVQMYLGLALLFPFFNVLWKGLDSQKKHRALVWSLVILTTLPSLLNTYNLSVADWWKHPSTSDEYQLLISDWWQCLYPVTYYFLGAYLKTYPPKKRPWQYALGGVGAVAVFGAYNVYRSWGSGFVWAGFNEYYGFQSLLVSWLIFAFWLRVPCQRLPQWARRVLGILSPLTLGAYLVSWCFDQWLYPALESHFYPIAQRFAYYPLCIAISAIGSLAVSALIQLAWLGLQKLIHLPFLKKR